MPSSILKQTKKNSEDYGWQLTEKDLIEDYFENVEKEVNCCWSNKM